MNHFVTVALMSLGCFAASGLAGCTTAQPTANTPLTESGSTTTPTTTAQAPSPTNATNAAPTAAAPASNKTATTPTPQASGQATPVAAATPTPALRPPLTVEKLKNAEYYFLAKGPIRLVNGKYEDAATKRTYALSDVVTYGDINKDGIKDAVTVLKVTIPNTGDFSYLVALANEGGNPKNISSEFMGSGIVIKTLKVNPDNSIEAVMDQYQAGDPACCPSLKITRTYKLKLNQPSPAAVPPAK